MDIDLAIVNLQDIVNIIDGAKELAIDIADTTSLVSAAESSFVTAGLSKTGVKKLVADIKASGTPIQSVEFKQVGKNIQISTTGSSSVTPSVKSMVVSALQPLLSRDITATAIEPAKRIQLAALKADAKSRGLTNASFDKVVKNAVTNSNQFSKYVMVSKDGFMLSVSNPINIPSSGGGSGGGSGGTQETQVVDFSFGQEIGDGSLVFITEYGIESVDQTKTMVAFMKLVDQSGNTRQYQTLPIIFSSNISVYEGPVTVFVFPLPIFFSEHMTNMRSYLQPTDKFVVYGTNNCVTKDSGKLVVPSSNSFVTVGQLGLLDDPPCSCSSSCGTSCGNSCSCGSSCGSSGYSSSGDLPDLSSISFDNLGSYYSIIGDVPSYATQEGNFTTIENNPDQTNLLYSGVSTYQLTLGLLGVQSDISNLTAYFKIYRMDSESGNILLVSTEGTIYQSDNLWKARTTITTSDGTLLSNTGNYAMEVYIQEELIGWVNFTVALP